MPPTNDAAPVLTIAELNRQARRLLESGFPLMWVAGEVSNLTRAGSGHVYFSLKDDAAQVRCVMFRQRAQLLPWDLAAGQQVEALVRVTLYEPRGDFQLGVEALRRAGIGRLYEAYARLKAQLEAEGLFAAERKRELPAFPHRVAVITSAQAAALQDARATFARRAPQVILRLFPTLVQGLGAVEGIVAALGAAGRDDALDAVLLIRGGGSIEDLWAFNDERVARAIAACPVPVVCGIGHETDTTIADFVADRRAATPTAAAELLSAGWFAARQRLQQLQKRLVSAWRWRLDHNQQRLDHLAQRLVPPAVRLSRARERLGFLSHRLDQAWRGRMQREHMQLALLARRLLTARPKPDRLRQSVIEAAQRLQRARHAVLRNASERLERATARLSLLDPQRTLARGYAIVRGPDHRPAIDSGRLQVGQSVAITLARGALDAAITSVRAAERGTTQNPD